MRLSGHEILIHSFRQGQEFLQSEVPGKLKNTKWTKVLICKKCDANWPRNLLTVRIISAQMLGFVSDIPTLCVRERETVFFWLLFLRSETSGGRTLGQIWLTVKAPVCDSCFTYLNETLLRIERIVLRCFSRIPVSSGASTVLYKAWPPSTWMGVSFSASTPIVSVCSFK